MIIIYISLIIYFSNVLKLLSDDNYDDVTFQVHETFDDLGLGNHPDSSTTGHAGARLACCVIAVGGAGGGGGSSAAFPLANYTMVVTFALITCVFALLRLD